ncbi:hypothetical protein ACWC6I_17175 [Streptomyces sp. NPDC001414]
MRPPTPARRRRIAAVVVTVVCLGYAPIAATELWPYAVPGAPALGEWLLGRAVSPRYVTDALATRIAPYRHSLVPMIVHSVLGGLLMLLGPAQLYTAARRRPRAHRVLGGAFAVTVYASMAGAALYLARTAPRDAFSGAAFWIVLGAIPVGTVLSATFGILTGTAAAMAVVLAVRGADVDWASGPGAGLAVMTAGLLTAGTSGRLLLAAQARGTSATPPAAPGPLLR